MTSLSAPSPKLPNLENGDHLTRNEFERRYHQMPRVKKAELIEGIVYVASPLKYQQHGQPHSDIMTWLGVYRAATPRVYSADNTTEGTYQQQPADESGILKSPFFPGLWLDVSALLAGEMQQVLSTLNLGINSSEHQVFVEQLQKTQ